MTSAPSPVLVLENVVKNYGALRPLRIRSLALDAGAVVAVVGLDAPASEMFVNLATGATLPDEGEVRVAGESTAAITGPDEWLRSLDRFGIMSDRAVLLDDLTVAQNLAMTITLAVDRLDPATRERVERIAAEAGLPSAALDAKVAGLDAPDRARLRLARAVALDPLLLLMEHPTASLAADAVPAFAADARRLSRGRGLAAVAMTADSAFAAALTGDVRTLVDATGELTRQAGGAWGRVRRLFGAR